MVELELIQKMRRVVRDLDGILHNLVSVGVKISVGLTNFLVKVESMWVRDPWVYPYVFMKSRDQDIESWL